MTQFADIADYSEGDRITMIGHRAMAHKETVAFIVESGEGKAERYIEKLHQQFPGIRVIERGKGPVADTEFVKVGPPLE